MRPTRRSEVDEVLLLRARPDSPPRVYSPCPVVPHASHHPPSPLRRRRRDAADERRRSSDIELREAAAAREAWRHRGTPAELLEARIRARVARHVERRLRAAQEAGRGRPPPGPTQSSRPLVDGWPVFHPVSGTPRIKAAAETRAPKKQRGQQEQQPPWSPWWMSDLSALPPLPLAPKEAGGRTVRAPHPSPRSPRVPPGGVHSPRAATARGGGEARPFCWGHFLKAARASTPCRDQRGRLSSAPPGQRKAAG